MFRFKTFAAAPALVILMGGTAHAALTADQVWQSWKDGAAMGDVAITAATESNAGGVLTLNGVSIMPQGAPAAFTISDMTLTEEGDGSVTIRPGAAMGVDMTEGTNVFKMGVAHDGLTIVAREDGGALVYDFTAAKLDVDFNVSYEGYSWDAEQPTPVITNSGKVGMQGLAGKYSDAPGANRAFGLDLTAAGFAYDFNSDDPGLQMKTTSHSETTDMVMNLGVTMPSTTSLMAVQGAADFRKILDEGFAVAMLFEQGGNTGSAKQEDQFFPYEMTISGQPSKGAFVFNKDVIDVRSEGAGLQLSLTSPAMPAPVEISVGAVVMNMVMPVMATTPADVLLQTKLTQLTLSDGVWGMFDPGAALKREPLDLNIDVSGKTTLDFIGLMEAEETGAMPPIPAPEKLDITDISLKVAGAALDANGAFTFDNSMGIPMPLGTATVNVSGANSLIDGLIATGLLQEQDAMSARMMMGMFMTPTGDDSLTSKIEAKEGFAIFVNGQQIQ
ncbi:MAG: DUF2125 domain-containing protein [Paracoccaceae bacterium]